MQDSATGHNLLHILKHVLFRGYLSFKNPDNAVYSVWKPTGKLRKMYGDKWEDVIHCARLLYDIDPSLKTVVEEHLVRLYIMLGARPGTKAEAFMCKDGDRACMARVVQCLFG